MSIDPGALARLRARMEEVLGVDDTAAVLEPLTRVRWDRLATVDDLEGLATKADLEGFATKADLEPLATRAEVADEIRACELRLTAMFERRLGEMQRQLGDMQGHVRRDLLLVTGGQFFALIGAVTAVLALG